MKPMNLIVSLLIIVAVVAVGWGVIFTNGSQTEVDNQLADITPDEERIKVDSEILSRPIVSEVENYRTFGVQPVVPNAAALNRVNPFDNL